MVTKELAEAAKEVNEILFYLTPVEYVEKVPSKFRKFLKDIEDKEYKTNIDITKGIEEQLLKEKTKNLIAFIEIIGVMKTRKKK